MRLRPFLTLSGVITYQVPCCPISTHHSVPGGEVKETALWGDLTLFCLWINHLGVRGHIKPCLKVLS